MNPPPARARAPQCYARAESSLLLLAFQVKHACNIVARVWRLRSLKCFCFVVNVLSFLQNLGPEHFGDNRYSSAGKVTEMWLAMSLTSLKLARHVCAQ